MRPPRQPSDRLRELLRRHVAPGLADLGFRRRDSAFVAAAEEVAWLVDVEFAPWSTARRLTFTLAWGIYVPGLDDVLGDRAGVRRLRPWGCPVHGRLGEGRGGSPPATWFDVRPLPSVLARLTPLVDVLDARLAADVVHRAATALLPQLRSVTTVDDVQRVLADGIDRRSTRLSGGELLRIRQVVALSILRGERDNAERWLDYLAARSACTMAPDIVAERLAPLRERLAS